MSPRKLIDFEVDENGCFNCTSHKRDLGYPRIKFKSKNKIISRLIFEECFGEIPEGMFVCHKCDNPQCINPEHFFLGTNQDNMVDMAKKGRHGMQKLTFEQQEEIVDLLIKGELSQREIAELYGIHKATVLRLKRKRGLPKNDRETLSLLKRGQW